MTDELIASAEVLRLLRCASRTTLRAMRLRGELVPAETTALGHLYRRADVEALAEKRGAL